MFHQLHDLDHMYEHDSNTALLYIPVPLLPSHLTTHLVNGRSLAKHGSERIEVANGGFIQMHAQITKIITNLWWFECTIVTAATTIHIRYRSYMYLL